MENKEEEFDVDECNQNDILAQAQEYPLASINGIIDDVVYNFYQYKLSPDQLYGISKLSMLLKHPGKFEVDGYISFTVKQIINAGSFIFQEINSMEMDYN